MRILLVEDDASLRNALVYCLKKKGWNVTPCEDGNSAALSLEQGEFDAMILDRMLPGKNGIDLLRALRAGGSSLPVLMLTAMDGVTDRVEGLDAGADDYLLKPFAMEELLARVRALSRRQPRWTPLEKLTAGNLRLDAHRLLLTDGETTAELSRRECALMEVLMRNAGQVLPRAVLLDLVWGDAPVDDGNLDIHIHFLRKRLRGLRTQMEIITVRNVGYELR